MSASNRTPHLVAITIAVALASPASATISDLTAFIQRAEKMTAFNRSLRADVRVTRPDGSTDAAIVVVDPSRVSAFVAVKSQGFRALVPLAWKAGKAVARTGVAAAEQRADDVLGDIGLRATDLFPAWAQDYSTSFISDETAREKTVTIYGSDQIPYSLFVVTFDKERLVPTMLKYYRDRLNNLVRLRQDADHEMVGARPRPRKITVTDYVENTTYSFELEWKELASAPAALFDEIGFASAEIDWPVELASTD
jgi:hypothetical protein